jgi:hypothetical protein
LHGPGLGLFECGGVPVGIDLFNQLLRPLRHPLDEQVRLVFLPELQPASFKLLLCDPVFFPCGFKILPAGFLAAFLPASLDEAPIALEQNVSCTGRLRAGTSFRRSRIAPSTVRVVVGMNDYRCRMALALDDLIIRPAALAALSNGAG